MKTVGVFVDYQNVYRRARDTVVQMPPAGHWEGQINPRLLGLEIAGRKPNRTLGFVRVYRGMPDGARDAKGYAACSKQVAAWSALADVEAFTRPLRYPRNFPVEKPSEKGIDVQIAIDFVMMAMQRRFDVGVIFSADTDLKPALEAVLALGVAEVEVAAWQPPVGYASRLSLPPPRKLWCHFLDQQAYGRVADLTDYNL